jgi:hypothetical protein
MADHTPGPWVQFVSDGKCVAIMAAMRAGDICSFSQPPTDADARLIASAPIMVRVLEKIAEVSRKDSMTAEERLKDIQAVVNAMLDRVGGDS